METRANLAAVGLFVVAMLAAGFGVVYWLVVGDRAGAREQVVIVFPGPVGGLVPGANVSFNGIRVGEIARLDFAPDDPNRVVAIASVKTGTPIKRDSRAALAYQGLTGVAGVSIYGGSKGAAPLLTGKPGDAVIFAEASGVQDLIEGAQRVIGKADATLSAINSLVGDNRAAIDQTIRNAETFSGALARNSGNVERFMSDVGRAADVLAKVSGKVEVLVDNLDQIAKAVEPAKIGQTVDSVAKISTDLAKSSGEIEKIVRDAQAAVADARRTVAAVDAVKLGALLEDSARVASDLAKSSGRVEGVLLDAQTAIGDARKVIDAVDPTKISKTVEDISKIASDIAGSSGRFEALVRDSQATVADARKLVSAVDPQAVRTTVEAVARFSTFVGTKIEDLEAIVASSRSAVANIDGFTANLSSKSPDVVAIIDDVRKLAARFEFASQRIDGILAKVDGLVGSEDGAGLFAQGRTFFEEAIVAARAVRESAAAVRTRVSDIADGINRFTAVGLREVRDLVGEGRRTLGTIDRAVSELDRNPSRIIFGGGNGNVPDYGSGRR